MGDQCSELRSSTVSWEDAIADMNCQQVSGVILEAGRVLRLARLLVRVTFPAAFMVGELELARRGHGYKRV
jgi:hypothetical protein